MFHEKVDPAPLWAWTLAGASAPIAMLAARGPWLSCVCLAAVCGLLCWSVQTLAGEPLCSRAGCAVQFAFLPIFACEMARLSLRLWEGGEAPYSAFVLLALATAGAWNGAKHASHVGGVIFWFLALLYALTLGSGVKNVHFDFLRPDFDLPDARLPAVLLLPAATALLPAAGKRWSARSGVALAAFTATVGLLVAGTLSGGIAARIGDPFYEYSKSLSLFGVAERFEALVSVALTMGFYAVLSILLSMAGLFADTIRPGLGRWGVVLCAVAAGALLLLPAVPGAAVSAGSILLWGAFPLARSLWQRGNGRNVEVKKVEKKENP